MSANVSEAAGERVLVFALVTTGALAARLAITEPGTLWYVPLLILGGSALLALTVAGSETRTPWLTRGTGAGVVLTNWAKLLGFVLLVAPFAAFVLRTLGPGAMLPLEQVAILALSNFAFFATALWRFQRTNAIAVGIASVLLLAGLVIGEHAAITPLAAVFGGLSVVWLALHHWQSVCVSAVGRRVRRLPLVPVFSLTLALGGITAASSRFANGTSDVWGQWVPASGGSHQANPDAVLGVGDGERVTSGPDAMSTGPVDSDHFLESEMPSLWDVLTDSYGEPMRPAEVKRTMTEDAEKMLKNDGAKPPHLAKAGREFSLYRRSRAKRPPPPEDAAALFYVEGRAPLHLALAAYDHFDGIQWYEPPETAVACRMQSDSTAPWLWLPTRPLAVCGGTRSFTLRFGLFSSERIPLTNHLERFRIAGKAGTEVKRWVRDVLVWAYDGILQARQELPQGTVFQMGARTIDRSRLFLANDLLALGADRGTYRHVPERLKASADALADQFAHLPRGWEQIDAVLAHLRTHYTHDRDAQLPEGCPDPVHHFLEEARGGPAYQFATAAALALRRMDYPTRVVSGFYVDPKNYVARAGHIAIQPEDAHVWIEVRTAEGPWITLDPTPGFQTEWHRPTLYESVVMLGAMLVAPMAANPGVTLASVTLSAILWLCRLRVRERLLTVWCRWAPIHASARLRATLALLDLRCRLVGQGRPPSRTPQAWYRRFDSPPLQRFIRHLYGEMYGAPAGRSGVDVRRLCQGALRAARTERLRDVVQT